MSRRQLTYISSLVNTTAAWSFLTARILKKVPYIVHFCRDKYSFSLDAFENNSSFENQDDNLRYLLVLKAFGEYDTFFFRKI